MKPRLLLLTGIPGTGKTEMGKYLEETQGFLHVNREMHSPPEFSKDPAPFLASTERDIVASWGFRPKEMEDVQGILQLVSLGFRGVWFDGHRPWALEQILRDRPQKEWEFYLQMFNVETSRVASWLSFPRLDPFRADGTFREKSDIASDLLSLLRKE